MSTGLFRLRPLRRGRNLKHLTILAPLSRRGAGAGAVYLAPSPIVEATRHVILGMMYSFTGQLDQELTCAKGTYVKFILRPGLGWLEVETVVAPIRRGYVPALYVLIAVNNDVDPITLEWLQATPHPVVDDDSAGDTTTDSAGDTTADSAGETTADTSADSAGDSGDACSVALLELFDFENVYPETVAVDKAVRTSDGLALCLCLTMHRSDTLYIGKLVAELAALDASWRLGAIMFGLAPGIDVDPSIEAPALPSPPSAHDTTSLYQYCQQLNHYWHQVLDITQFKRSQQLADFIGSSVQVVCRDGKGVGDNDTTRTLFGDDADVVLRMTARALAVHTPIELSFDLDDSSDAYRHYSLGLELLFLRLVKLQTVPTTPVTSHTHHPDFPDTPTTPPMEADVKRVATPDLASTVKPTLVPAVATTTTTTSTPDNDAQAAPAGPPPGPPRRQLKRGVEPLEYLKIKIHIQNDENDVIVLKIKRTNLILVVYLKKLVSFKIYKDYSLIDHYDLTPVDLAPLDDDGLLAWLKNQQKAVLNLLRIRRKHDASDDS